jgi:protein-arginine kinase activator protein McsA
MRDTCDLCGDKPAKNHLCEIVDGKQTSLDLCDDCFRARGAANGLDMPILDGTQRCYYCEEPAQACGMNLEWEQAVRGERFHFTCFRCAALFHRFLLESLRDIPKGLSQDEELEAMTAAIAESDRKVCETIKS